MKTCTCNKPLDQYSTDIRDAMPLWKDGWTIWRNGEVFALKMNSQKEVIRADTLETILCHATLIEAKGDR